MFEFNQSNIAPKIVVNGLMEKTLYKFLLQISILLISAVAIRLPIVSAFSSIIVLISQLVFLYSSIMMHSVTSSINSRMSMQLLSTTASRTNRFATIIAVCLGFSLGAFIRNFDYYILGVAFALFTIAAGICAYIAQNKAIIIRGNDLTKAIYVLLGLMVVSMFFYMEWLEVAICAIGIPVSIGLIALEIRRVSNLSDMLDSQRWESNKSNDVVIDILSTYVTSRILVNLFNLFIYILRIVSLMMGSRRRRE